LAQTTRNPEGIAIGAQCIVDRADASNDSDLEGPKHIYMSTCPGKNDVLTPERSVLDIYTLLESS